MTLEQIKNKQVDINCVLTDLLDKSYSVLFSIAGSNNSCDEKEQISAPYPDWLLGQISYEQEQTEMLIDKLLLANKRLAENTYAPSEPLCVGR